MVYDFTQNMITHSCVARPAQIEVVLFACGENDSDTDLFPDFTSCVKAQMRFPGGTLHIMDEMIVLLLLVQLAFRSI